MSIKNVTLLIGVGEGGSGNRPNLEHIRANLKISGKSENEELYF